MLIERHVQEAIAIVVLEEAGLPRGSPRIGKGCVSPGPREAPLPSASYQQLPRTASKGFYGMGFFFWAEVLDLDLAGGAVVAALYTANPLSYGEALHPEGREEGGRPRPIQPHGERFILIAEGAVCRLKPQ